MYMYMYMYMIWAIWLCPHNPPLNGWSILRLCHESIDCGIKGGLKIARTYLVKYLASSEFIISAV